MTRRALLLFVLLLVVGIATAVAMPRALRAQSPRGDRTPENKVSLEYLRIHVPADETGQWPREGVRYAPPIDEEEFHRLIETIASSTGSPAPGGSKIATAQYAARWDRELTLRGQASLDVVHLTSQQAVVSLDGCGLAMSRPEWDEADPREAIVGLSGNGQLVAVVEKSSTLTFDWSLRGSPAPGGSVEFVLQLPSCPAGSLTLDLPDTIAPTIDVGIVSGPLEIEEPPSDDAPAQTPATETPATETLQRWRIELGGHRRATLRLVPLSRAQPVGRLVPVRHTATYDFSLRGVELSTVLTFDVCDQPLSHVDLTLDPGLQLIAARHGNRNLAWTGSSAGADEPSRVALELPEPLAGYDCVLTLDAVAPIPLGQPWRLPAVRPMDMFWQKGSVRLRVPKTLAIKRLSVIREDAKGTRLPSGRQISREPSAEENGGESIDLQLFHPEAVVEVVVDRPADRVELRCGTSLDWQEDRVQAKTVAELRAAHGERFLVTATVQPAWTVDSVEAQIIDPSEEEDPDVLEGFREEKTAGKGRVLKISLRKALQKGRSIRLIVTSHRPVDFPPDSGIETFRPLQLHEVKTVKELMSAHTDPAHQLKLSGNIELTRLVTESLDPADMNLLEDRTGSLAWAVDAKAGRDAFRLNRTSEKPRFSASIRVEATLKDESLVETYALRCEPESAPVAQLLVHLSQDRDSPLDWSVVGEGGAGASATRLSEAEQLVAGIGTGGETWEITLRRPRSVPFEIRASRFSPLGESEPISLASLPEITDQEAILTISSAGAHPIRIHSGNLKTIPNPTLPFDTRSTLQAAYRYEPLRDALAAATPAVTVSLAPTSDGQPTIWAWAMTVRSQFAADGAVNHQATYFLENVARSEVRLTLPPGTTLHGLSVDRRVLASAATAESGSTVITAPLPTDNRYPVLTVSYGTKGHRLRTIDRIGAPVPEIDVPVLDRQWIVWIPPGYAAYGSASGQGAIAAAPDWRRRLFGPLRRRPSERPFNLFGVEDWASLATAVTADRSASIVRPMLEAFGSDGGTWRRLLEQIRTTAEQDSSGLSLLLDRQSLLAEGISPDTPLAPIDEATGTQRGLLRLKHSRLVLLTCGRMRLLVGRRMLACYPGEVEWSSVGPVGRVLPGRLQDEMTAGLGQPRRLVTIEGWLTHPEAAGHVFYVQDSDDCGMLAEAGWSTARLELTETSQPELSIYRPQTLHSFGAAAFLISAALAWWLLLVRIDRFALAVGISGIVALVAPVPYVPILTGTFLGLLLSGIARLVRSRPEKAPVDANSATETPRSVPAVPEIIGLIIAGIISIALVTRGYAQLPESADAGGDSVRKTQRVLVPVDENQKPTGKYYLPEDFYIELARRARAAEVTSEAWVLQEAHYSGTLDHGPSSAGLVVSELKARYDVTVRRRASRVRIPLRRSQVNVPAGGARLDGVPIQPEWADDGSAIFVDVTDPGKYRLELTLLPATSDDDTTGRLDLTIPKVPESQLELTLPTPLPAVWAPSALGWVTVDREAGRLLADLGPTDRLSLRWSYATGGDGARSGLQVEELYWLKMQPGSVVLHARLHFKSGEEIRRLRIEAEPQIRLLPPDQEQPQWHFTRQESEDVQTLEFELAEPFAKEVTLELSFALAGTSELGYLTFPRIRPLVDHTLRRLLAVSVDPALTCELPSGAGGEALSVTEFLSAWGNDSVQPDLAWQLSADGVPWFLASHPRDPETVADQSLTVSFSREAAVVTFDASLDTTGGYRFQYLLSVPRGMVVDGISVRDENDAEQTLRFSHDASGKVTVFLRKSASGPQRLTMKGTLATPPRGKLPAGKFRVEILGVTSQSYHYRILRRPGVLVEVVEATGLVPAAEPDLKEDDVGRERLVASMKAVKNTHKLTLELSPNDPAVRGRQIIAIRREGDDLAVVADYRMEVTKGMVDFLRFEIPPSCCKSLEIDPPTAYEIRDVPGEGIRHLIVRPEEPVTSSYAVRITARGAISPRDRVYVPDIVPMDVAQVDRFVVVPTQLQSQKVAWETRGLRASSLPESDAGTSLLSKSAAVYRVVGRRFQAVMKSVRHSMGAASVRLADVAVIRQQDGTCYGMVTFDLSPAGLARATLDVPKGFELIQATLAGLPARLTASEDGARQLALGPEEFPQRLEVVFAGRVPAGATRDAYHIPYPVLRDLHVERTLWTVYAPPRDGTLELVDTSRQIDGFRQEMFRLKSVTLLSSLPQYVRTDSPQGEIDRWFLPWQRRWRASRSRVAQWQLQPTEKERVDGLEIALADRRQATAAKSLGAEQIREQVLSEAATGGDLAELDGLASMANRRAVRGTLQGAGGEIAVRSTRGFSDLAARLLVALAMAVGTAAFCLLGRREDFRQWFLRWPHLAGVLLGLAWWLWLTPSAVGWVIVAASLAATPSLAWRGNIYRRSSGKAAAGGADHRLR